MSKSICRGKAAIAVAVLLASGCNAVPVVAPSAEPDGEEQKAPIREQLDQPSDGRDGEFLRRVDAERLERAGAEIRRAFEIWEVLCAPCHGRFGRGDGSVAGLLTIPPGDLTDAEQVVLTSDDERTAVIKEGIDGTPMIGWKRVLDDEEVELLNGYLRFLLAIGREGDGR